ncbi:glycosyltransferase [Qipengyuania sp. 1NDW9]|uniref:glycosyltransferase n=1 Tax=Qipengyuania xiapuensis TaxID=2867236 RepID=UPI001C87D4BA|nr:glycosyltransferase [Qipengyuania xiapuensis]MBX7492154.1 glycosyltransferase [Qipengyuania xiapuensis]
MSVTLLVPTLDEERVLPELVALFERLDPKPAEIMLVDGGSTDRTCEIAREAGWRVIESEKGRALQINNGVEAARGEIVCVVHADTHPPADMVQVIEETLADQRIALASFTPVIRGPKKTRWGTTIHNWAKTWYAPLITRPHLFVRGVRLLFGDHAMFFRRADFIAVGGCTPGDQVMEEADLCVKLAQRGRVKMVPRRVYTSDRRIAEWGALKANWIYFKVGMLWAFGLRGRMAQHYPDVR